MNNSEDIKDMVRQKYADIVSKEKSASSCGCGCTSADQTEIFNIMGDDYQKVQGYFEDADYGLGCGLPTEFAEIQEGDTVVDLGSGAGNDCFIARRITGESGKVIGIDFTPAMIEKARANAQKLGYTNVEFIEGDIENLPLEDNTVNVVISNCVLNLVPNKRRAFTEIFRVLKNEGHLCVSDIVLKGQLPEKIREAAAMYAGCISGALQKNDYLMMVQDSGFFRIIVYKEKEIILPDEVLTPYLSQEEIELFRKSGTGIYSITVNAEKPYESICGCGCGC